MALTPVHKIYSPDDPNPWKLVTDLATMANTMETALNNVAKGANLFVGTAAQRAAAQTSATVGQHWQDTDGERKRWIRGNTQWEELTSGDYRVGTSAQRAGVVSRYGQIWQDSDDRKLKWKGRTDGTWTRFSGRISVSGGAPSLSGNGWAHRVSTATLPCALESTEIINTWMHKASGGYQYISLVDTTPGATTTAVGLRTSQYGTTVAAFEIGWQLAEYS